MSSQGQQGEKEEDADETNPFSFKEFVKIKSRSTTKGKESSTGIPFEVGATAPKGLSLSLTFPERYFPVPTAHSPSLDEEDDDWSETYQPAEIEAAHEFSFSDSLHGVSYAPLTLSPAALPQQDSSQYAPSEWQVGEEEEGDEEEEEEDEGGEKDYIEGDTASQLGTPCEEHDPPTDHFDLVGEVLYQSQLLNNEKLKEENALLRKQTKEAKQLAKDHIRRTRRLEEELERRKITEEKETRALEAMVQQVEENLQLMTKRAVKAENTVTKLKQEFVVIQAEVQHWKSENVRLRSGDSLALNSAKSNARLASDYLVKAVQGAESSVKQLLSGAETLRLVSELLRTIDRISELPAQDREDGHS
uniref:endosome-associated-trafficking regulator 1 n=1 Tax=Pristiophorus japonicus TaxID=55135 RepID=UPI00398F4145